MSDVGSRPSSSRRLYQLWSGASGITCSMPTTIGARSCSTYRIVSIAACWAIEPSANMTRQTAKLGFGDNWHEDLQHVENQHVEPGQQPQLVNDLRVEDIATVKDLVTVPPLVSETWRMFMLSPEVQNVSPFFLGGDDILVAYPTNTSTPSS